MTAAFLHSRLGAKNAETPPAPLASQEFAIANRRSARALLPFERSFFPATDLMRRAE